jgi:hypothetical protein
VCAALLLERKGKERKTKKSHTHAVQLAGGREREEKEKEKLVPLKKWQTLNTNRISLLLLQHLT